MKRIKGIGEAIKNFEGEKFTLPGGKDFTFKYGLFNLMTNCIGKDGEESLALMEMGLRLKDSTDVFEFKEEEEAVLKKIINENKPQLFAPIIGAIYEKIKYAEAFKKESK
jgi:hypothetical protein